MRELVVPTLPTLQKALQRALEKHPTDLKPAYALIELATALTRRGLVRNIEMVEMEEAMSAFKAIEDQVEQEQNGDRPDIGRHFVGRPGPASDYIR